MTFKVAVDAGHGINTPGKRTPDGEREWTFNDKNVDAFIKELNKYEGVEVLRVDDSTGKTDVPLSTRTNKANDWGANIFVSFHHNANTGQWGDWTGTETYTYLGKQTESEKLAACVHPEIVKAYGLHDRGLKKKNLHIVRETEMPSILIEGGYMDSKLDIKRLRSDSILATAGINAAHGVAKYAELKKKVVAVKPTPKPVVKPAAKPEPKPVTKPKTTPKPVAKPKAEAVVPYPGKLIKVGSKGKDVERIQRAVNESPVDGIFGKGTEAAVKAYQKKHGLTADGIVGESTWNKMF